MTKKKRSTPRKGVQRPVISEDPRAAATELHKSTVTAKAQFDVAKREFDAAHAEGMAALKRQDYDALGHAIKRELRAIKSIPTTRKPRRRK